MCSHRHIEPQPANYLYERQAKFCRSAQLARVIQFIEQNLHAPLPIDRLASLAAMSKTTFTECFRSNTGLPPHRYVLRRRVARSKQLLVASELSLVQIAIETGFSSQAHMTSTFRRFTGWTPQSYRSWQHCTQSIQSANPGTAPESHIRSYGAAAPADSVDVRRTSYL